MRLVTALSDVGWLIRPLNQPNTEILIFAGSATLLPRLRKIMGSLFVLQLHRMTSREKRYAR